MAKPTDVPARPEVRAPGGDPQDRLRPASPRRVATTSVGEPDDSEEGVRVDRGAPRRPVYPARGGGLGGSGGLLGNARLAWAVAVVALALLAGLTFATVGARREAAELRGAAETRQEVQEAAEVAALQVATFDGASIEEWLATTQSLATGSFRDDLGRLYTQEFRDGLRDNQVRSVGTITDSFVQRVEGDNAEVFLLLGQVASNATTTTPIEDELRMEVELMRVDGRWLASDVAVLGPESLSRQADELPGGDAEAPASDSAVPAPGPQAPAPASTPG